jgi:hypothetical protein
VRKGSRVTVARTTLSMSGPLAAIGSSTTQRLRNPSASAGFTAESGRMSDGAVGRGAAACSPAVSDSEVAIVNRAASVDATIRCVMTLMS